LKQNILTEKVHVIISQNNPLIFLTNITSLDKRSLIKEVAGIY